MIGISLIDRKEMFEEFSVCQYRKRSSMSYPLEYQNNPPNMTDNQCVKLCRSIKKFNNKRLTNHIRYRMGCIFYNERKLWEKSGNTILGYYNYIQVKYKVSHATIDFYTKFYKICLNFDPFLYTQKECYWIKDRIQALNVYAPTFKTHEKAINNIKKRIELNQQIKKQIEQEQQKQEQIEEIKKYEKDIFDNDSDGSDNDAMNPIIEREEMYNPFKDSSKNIFDYTSFNFTS